LYAIETPYEFYAYAWLDAWLDAIDDPIKAEQHRKDFKCYNPISSQSSYTKSHYYRDHNNIAIGTTTTMMMISAEAEAEADKKDIRNRFDVIGDTAQMAKSVCAIQTRYTGWVRPAYNCTTVATTEEEDTTTSNNNNVGKAQQQQKQKKKTNSRVRYMTADSHGVNNHGATTETTPYHTKTNRLPN
jgi:hypothetical protein